MVFRTKNKRKIIKKNFISKEEFEEFISLDKAI